MLLLTGVTAQRKYSSGNLQCKHLENLKGMAMVYCIFTCSLSGTNSVRSKKCMYSARITLHAYLSLLTYMYISFTITLFYIYCASRTIADIEESENRARNQAEYLKSSLEEHSLELRVKAATEAEAACQQRLSFAEAELEELRAKVDASERFVFCSREQCYVYKLEQLIVVDYFNSTYLKKKFMLF